MTFIACIVASIGFTPTLVSGATDELLNVQFGAHLSPGLDANKAGVAAVGQSAGDYWNFYSRDTGSNAAWQVNGAVANLKLADGTATMAGLVVSNAPGCWANGSSDAMYNTYVYPFSGTASVSFTNLAAGSYDVYVYAHDGNYQLTVGGSSYGTQSCQDDAPAGVAVWQQGRQYVKYAGVNVGLGQTMTLAVLPGVHGYAVIAGIQLVFSASPPPPTNSFLVDVNFGAHLSPGLNANKVGVAATGQTTNDFWNFYSRDNSNGTWRANGALPNLKQANGTSTTVGLVVNNAAGSWANGSSDAMYNTYIYPSGGGNATVTLTNLPAGQYDLYVYAYDGNYQVAVGGVSSAIKTTWDKPITNPPVWQQGRQYVLFQGLNVGAGQPVVLTVRPGQDGFAIISGLQIASSTSNSTNVPPSIVNQPVDQTVVVGAITSFSVTAEGTAPLSYQWRFNGTSIPWATSSLLVLTNVLAEQAGAYSVQISNVAGAVISSNAQLVVVQPVTNELLNVQFGAHLSPGLNASKTGVAAVGQSAGDYWNFYSRDTGSNAAWQVNGAVANLKLADGTATMAGLVVSNAPGCWANGSSDAMYNNYVYPFSGTASVSFTNLAAGNYDVYVYAHDGNYQLTVGGSSYGTQSCQDDAPAGVAVWQQGRQYVKYAGVNVASGQAMTLAVLPGVHGYAVIAGVQLVFSASPPPPTNSFLVDVNFGAHLSPGLNTNKTGVAAVGQTAGDVWNFYSRDNSNGTWRANGALANLKQADGTATAVGLVVNNAAGSWANGSLDAMYNTYIYPSGGGNATVTLTNLPAGQYDLYVYAYDGNYQVSVGGVTSPIKTTWDKPITNPPVWQQGRQYALFQGLDVGLGQPVVLTVRPGQDGFAIISGLQIASSTGNNTNVNVAPLIVDQPDDQTVLAGSSVSFSVSAQGSAPLSYQWRFNGTDLASETGTSLTLSNVVADQTGAYSVRISNVAGAVISSNAQLVVVQPVTNELLNVQFGAHLSPGLDANKTGVAAVGQSAADYWNFYSRDRSNAVWQVNGAVSNLKLADGTATMTGLVVSNAPGCWANGSSDAMYNNYVYPFSGTASVSFTNLAAGNYDVYVYAHDGHYQLTVGGSSYGTQSCQDDAPAGVAVWQQGRQYVKYAGVNVASGQAMTLAVLPGVHGYAVIAGVQLVFSASPPPPTNSFLVDVDFGAGAFTTKTGAAAIGQNGDFWNFYTRDENGAWRTSGALTNLKLTDGTATTAGLTVENAPGAWGNGSSDVMYDGYLYPFSGDATVTLTNLPPGPYDLYVYAYDGNYQLSVGGMNYGPLRCYDNAPSGTPVWQQGRQYVLFSNVTVTGSAPLVLTVQRGQDGYAVISGLQITGTSNPVQSGSRNLSLRSLPGQAARVSLTGVPAQRYTVQASTDLTTWVNLGCTIADDSGRCEFEDRDSNKFPQRYYRVIIP